MLSQRIWRIVPTATAIPQSVLKTARDTYMEDERWIENVHEVWRSWHHCTVAHLGDSRCYLNGSTVHTGYYQAQPTAGWMEGMHRVETTMASLVCFLPPSLLPSQFLRHSFTVTHHTHSLTHWLSLSINRHLTCSQSFQRSFAHSSHWCVYVHPRMRATVECPYIGWQMWTTLPEPRPTAASGVVFFSKFSKATTGESREAKSST